MYEVVPCEVSSMLTYRFCFREKNLVLRSITAKKYNLHVKIIILCKKSFSYLGGTVVKQFAADTMEIHLGEQVPSTLAWLACPRKT